MVDTEMRLQPKMEHLYSASRNKIWSSLWLSSSASYCTFQPQIGESRQNRYAIQSEKSESENRSVVSDSLPPYGLQPTRLLCPWNSPGQSTGVGNLFLLQWIFPTQGSNPGLLHCRQILYQLSHREDQEYWSG